METEKLLDEAIEDCFNELTRFEADSEPYQTILERLTRLCKLKTEFQTSEKERSSKDEEIALKKEQFKEEKKNSYFKLGVDVTGIILPLIFYGVWMNRGLKFEETGTLTSGVFKGLIGKFRTTK